jgi:NarL family two-component system response regulator YdfI
MGKEDVLLHITPWERSALQSLANGMTIAQLAIVFGAPERDIEQRLTSLFSKMGAASPTDAVAAALRRGLIPVAPGHDA